MAYTKRAVLRKSSLGNTIAARDATYFNLKTALEDIDNLIADKCVPGGYTSATYETAVLTTAQAQLLIKLLTNIPSDLSATWKTEYRPGKDTTELGRTWFIFNISWGSR